MPRPDVKRCLFDFHILHPTLSPPRNLSVLPTTTTHSSEGGTKQSLVCWGQFLAGTCQPPSLRTSQPTTLTAGPLGTLRLDSHTLRNKTHPSGCSTNPGHAREVGRDTAHIKELVSRRNAPRSKFSKCLFPARKHVVHDVHDHPSPR